MSNERNVEAVGCDASIMKNVWEIREREYEQKMKQEQDRVEKSALTTINQDWANRLAARQGNYKRPERKREPVENAVDEANVWKTKKPQAPPPAPRGAGTSPLSRPAPPSRGPSSSTSTITKDKKLPDKNQMKMRLIMFINQNLPSTMVWGKSWKYNKSLPVSAEGDEARLDWGQCWMFATQQPFSEPGKPWKNGPNLMDLSSLHFWEKLETRMVELQELDLDLPVDKWEVAWKKSIQSDKDKSTEDGEKFAKYRWFKELEETQRYNEELCTDEWYESWQVTKPGREEIIPTPKESSDDNNTEMSSMIEDWKLLNHLGRNKVKTTQAQMSLSSAWSDSWRAATVISDDHKAPNASPMHGGTSDDQQREPNHHKMILVSHDPKYKILHWQISDEFKTLSEWVKSWEVTKNNSKPCEEIKRVLQLSQETPVKAQKVESPAKAASPTSETMDPQYEQLKHSVLYQPKRELTQSQLLCMKHLGNVLSTSEWKESWRTMKHRMRLERRRYRPEPSRPFRAHERGGDRAPPASEWKDSWKFTSQPLQQEPEAWQQGWDTVPQVRVDRAREWNHFAPVELPKNGPTTERSWDQSWRFSRHQRQAEAGQTRARTSYPDNSWLHRRSIRATSDWLESWMVSETQFSHDRPSLTQWRESWQWSVFHTEHWAEQMPRETHLSASMEIQPQRERMSLQRAQERISQSFDSKMFKESFPEKEWKASWKAGPLLSHAASLHGSTETLTETRSNNVQKQHGTNNGHGSKWGRCFRIANPMPQVDQPWEASNPNPSYFTVMWFREMNAIKNRFTPKFSTNPTNFTYWATSSKFLQGASVQSKDKTKPKEPVDPMVIMTKKINTRKDLFGNIEKEKHDAKKWAGCHLLGKTQPRPKKSSTPAKAVKMEEGDDKFFEEWMESWKFVVKPGSLNKPVKSLRGWTESWKCLIPPYPMTNGHKTR